MDVTLTKPKLRILRLLSDEPMHGYELSDEVGLHGSTVYAHLHDLEEAGYIRGKKDGRRIIYQPTEKGDLILKAEDLDE